MSNLTMTKAATPSTPTSNKSVMFVDTADRRFKQIDDMGVVNTLVNQNAYAGRNFIINGGFRVLQRCLAALTNVTSSATARVYCIADRWGHTAAQITTPQFAQIDTSGAIETGLTARYYGQFKQTGGVGKMCISQPIEAKECQCLRGKTVRLQAKMKYTTAFTPVIRIGILSYTGTADTDTRTGFISAFNGAGVDPTWIANAALITPTLAQGPTGTAGTITGSAVSCTLTTSWQLFSACFAIPTAATNIIPVFYTDYQMAVNDIWDISEVGLYLGQEILDWQEQNAGDELLTCQRFFCKSFPQAIVPAASVTVANGGYGCCGIQGKTGSGTTSGCKIPIQWPVVMRAAPALTLWTPITTGAVAYRFTGASLAAQGTTAAETNATTDRGTNITVTNEATTNGTIGDLIGVHYSADIEF